MNLLLESALQADWITTLVPILRYIFIGIIFVCAIVMIVTVLMQSDSNNAASSAISGVQESYFSQNKGESRDGILKKITIAMVSIIAICILLYFITLFINTSV